MVLLSFPFIKLNHVLGLCFLYSFAGRYRMKIISLVGKMHFIAFVPLLHTNKNLLSDLFHKMLQKTSVIYQFHV